MSNQTYACKNSFSQILKYSSKIKKIVIGLGNHAQNPTNTHQLISSEISDDLILLLAVRNF